MKKALLFDLDGTLLPMDTATFVQAYIQSLVPHFEGMIPADALVPMLWHATQTMVKNTDVTYTNAQVFEQEFLNQSQMKKEEVWPVFELYYESSFPKLEEHVQYEQNAEQVILAAKAAGYRVVLATNPVFPQIAVYERLKWAGIDANLFEYITINEETHFCKPNPMYYQAIMEKLKLAPADCIMIGNDMQEDMIASELGMKTFYLSTDHRIDRGTPTYTFDQEGTMLELLVAIQTGSGIFQREQKHVHEMD
ncbi:HAD family hydrolase [Hazenella sp. IB182357]|uniref:HAD family hydrolase n=1 Tax=Polycladospora coralii TaxID=2771432 RepID=A0A926NA54_9BACL|nr:HAD family hydrolase [Polycladospora coralii]MBD1373056.1 HAD family hydrolase [Polycladospora coralii]MBS7529599.1 HAD family hydrolase [Polycladospora coralii]